MMKLNRIICALLVLVVSNTSYSQTLKKVPVSTSGCTVYTYCEMKFEISKSVDSSNVYMGECVNGDVTYGVIAVKLSNRPDNLVMAEDLLIAFLDHLKKSYSITNAAGYGRGYRLNNNENTRGVLDYWEDGEKNKWKVKGWTDGRYIGVMYGYSKKEMLEGKVNVFLEGLRFPISK